MAAAASALLGVPAGPPLRAGPWLFRRLHRAGVVRMGRPVGVVGLDPAPGAADRARRQPLHRDAVLHRADVDAEVARHAFRVVHLEMRLAVFSEDRLMGRVLAGGIAAPALDAGVLVDLRLGDVVEVQVLPVRDIRHRAARKSSIRGVSLLVHPVGQDPSSSPRRCGSHRSWPPCRPARCRADSAMNSAASRHVVTPPIPLIGSPGVSGSRAISATMLSAMGFTAGPQ